jgi:anaerobic selenocysteine-containing dehydrogenase
MSTLGDALSRLDSPAVKALVIYNSNPAAIAPDSTAVRAGLRRSDLFTVVLEQFQTDTADYADIVLPATTFLEHSDVYLAYGHYHLQMARAALPAPGEAKPNTEVFRLLAARMGFTEDCFRDSDDDLIRTALSSGHPFLEGITFERLEKEHSIRLNIPEPFLPFADGALTPDRKFHFDTPALAYTPPVESRLGDASLRSRFPLELVSSKNDDAMNSTFGYRAENIGATSTVFLHVEDAAPRQIADGDVVRVFNERGSVTGRAAVNGAVRTGVVRVPAVPWPKLTGDRQGINTLTSQRLTDAGGGPTFYSCLVQVEKCGD